VVQAAEDGGRRKPGMRLGFSNFSKAWVDSGGRQWTGVETRGRGVRRTLAK